MSNSLISLGNTFKSKFHPIQTTSDGSFWKEAIKSEVDSIMPNHIWELVDLPPGCKPLGSRWIFTKKMKAHGSIDKYKARLVENGFLQKYGTILTLFVLLPNQ